MSTKRYQNRQANYVDDYTIEYRWESSGYYTLWCSEHPDNPFDADVRKCHLYPNDNVCVGAGKEPRTMEVAEAVAFYWMTGYSEYVRTGVFRDTGARVHV